MKKAVVIGGGVAGMTTAALLRKEGWQVIVKEKRKILANTGLALLAKADALSIINSLASAPEEQVTCAKMHTFNLWDTSGKQVLTSSIEEWRGVKRLDIVKFLNDLLPEEIVDDEKGFSYFEYNEEGIATAAVFEDGTKETGDLFIGADGSNSAVHKDMYGVINYGSNDVNEIVCILDSDELNLTLGEFNKYQAEKGLSFGVIRLEGNQYVWFIQYSKEMYDETLASFNGEFKPFAQAILKEFPTTVKTIIDKSDFTNSYLWRTRDFTTVRPFHRANVVLIGDAAHLTLPFTSGGTSEAILDAKVLVEYLEEEKDIETALQKFDINRREEAVKINQLGTALKEQFLKGSDKSGDNFILPLVK